MERSERRRLSRNARGSNGVVVAGAAIAIVAVVVILLVLSAVGVITLFPAAQQKQSQPVAGASAIASIVTGDLQTNSSYAPASHTLTFKLAYDTSTSAYYDVLANTSNDVISHAPQFINVPIQLSRSDALNSSAGFNIVVNSLPTGTASGTTTAYSPIGYTASTSTSGGVWQFTFSAGSLKDSHPSQNAPTVASGLGPDLIGVSSFSSSTVTLGFTLAGGNSTSAAFASTGYAQYTTEQFSIAISGSGTGTVTPAAILVDLILI
jgi:hypothetical protein